MRADLSSVTFQDRAVYEVFQGSVLQEGFPLLSTYQGVCAICLSWHQADLEKRRLGEDATDGFAYLRGVGRRRRERRSLEPDSGMQRKDKSSWPWTEIENISWDPKKKPFSQWGWPSTGAGCPESLWRGCWALSWWKWSPCFAFTFPCPNSEPRHSCSFALCSCSASQEDACKSRRQFLYTSQSNLPNHDLKQNPITGPLFCPLDYY